MSEFFWDIYTRFTASAILAIGAAWLFVLVPFGAVGLREDRYVRAAAGVVAIFTFIAAWVMIEM